ncbi:MAG: hypothetical protein ACKOEV_06715 [Cytophagales bacterium]
MRSIFLSCVIFCQLVVVITLAQDKKEKQAVTFEELYDEPYSVNKLFIGFQPLYGELFATNVNAGFGIEASYYHKDKFDFKVNFRKTYSSQFFDFNRQAALDNKADGLTTRPSIFTYYELGGTYHIKDNDQSGKTKMVLYKKSLRGNRWAASVPLRAEVPCKVRKIIGARLGGIYWASSIDLNHVLKAQELTNASIIDQAGNGLPLQLPPDPISGLSKSFSVYGNMLATNAYVGGSLSWFRNVAVSFDKYEEGIDDGMLTLFFDLIYAPILQLDPVTYQGVDYSTDAIKTTSFGFRAGIDGKFNRTLSWSYGGEIGLRPSVSGQGFYAMFKISFPVFGTNLDYKVESFGK